MSNHCAMEECPNWSGDGRFCPCAALELEPRYIEDDEPYEREEVSPYGYDDD